MRNQHEEDYFALCDNPKIRRILLLILGAFMIIALFSGWLKPVELEKSDKNCWTTGASNTEQFCY